MPTKAYPPMTVERAGRMEVEGIPRREAIRLRVARENPDSLLPDPEPRRVSPTRCPSSPGPAPRLPGARNCPSALPTPAAVLTHLRQDMARPLLKDGQLAVAEVAFLPGYQDPKAFQRAYRRWLGRSPRAFRRAPG